MISRFFSDLCNGGLKNMTWLIQSMDMTQWGIVAVLFVLSGFVALKTRI